MKMDDEKNLITIREAFEIWVKVFYPNDFSKDRFKPEPDKVRLAQFQYDSETGEFTQPSEIVDSEEEIGDRFFDLGGLATGYNLTGEFLEYFVNIAAINSKDQILRPQSWRNVFPLHTTNFTEVDTVTEQNRSDGGPKSWCYLKIGKIKPELRFNREEFDRIVEAERKSREEKKRSIPRQMTQEELVLEIRKEYSDGIYPQADISWNNIFKSRSIGWNLKTFREAFKIASGRLKSGRPKGSSNKDNSDK